MDTPHRPRGILPLDAYLDLSRSERVDRYRFDPRTRVIDESEFSSMQEHVNRLYSGVEVVHSFEDPAGQIFDCIPIEQQPSLRGSSEAIPNPPDLRPVLQGNRPVPGTPAAAAPLETAPRDRHGNAMQAPPGTIPIRRVTLQELTRFRTMADYFHKSPEGTSFAPVAPSAEPRAERESALTGPSAPSTDVSQNHRYAYTHQTVDNLGGHNMLAVYAPAIDANQIFSLAQHWYTGGAGANHQTLEVGWQVFPGKYGHALPVLFIYWTADNYGSTGAYNLDAPGFVQTNSNWTIGGALSPVSVQGGQQMEIEVAVYLDSGHWWLYLGGITAANAVGYYPTSLYSGGQMASNATEILFGGETVTSAVSWPPMGSGAFAADGWQQAAYQRDIYYYPTGGGSQWAALTPEQPSPACYTLSLASAPQPWGVYFFFGGPGGADC
jgi:hypothetical protein